ncbi:MAG: AarF/UbiB family protein, partial [Pseudomonadota bacterium]|nr:AarF/UbiB family protein [Pseudomonadota bacterium]
MLWETLTAARDLGRLHDISSVLVRFGFGDMVRRLGMGQALEKAGRALHWKQAEELAQLEPPQRIRRALEELGPTFVKLGQMLATRPDLLPPDLIEELEKLQDAVPPIPFKELRPQLEEDLSGSPESVFAEFDTEPLAAASMAQVHRARLKDGQRVIVKIRRPGSRKTVEADLRLLARTAEIAELESPELRRYRPKEVVRRFTRSLHRELDLANEGRNAERMVENFKEDPDIHIPRVWWEWTSERI